MARSRRLLMLPAGTMLHVLLSSHPIMLLGQLLTYMARRCLAQTVLVRFLCIAAPLCIIGPRTPAVT